MKLKLFIAAESLSTRWSTGSEEVVMAVVGPVSAPPQALEGPPDLSCWGLYLDCGVLGSYSPSTVPQLSIWGQIEFLPLTRIILPRVTVLTSATKGSVRNGMVPPGGAPRK